MDFYITECKDQVTVELYLSSLPETINTFNDIQCKMVYLRRTNCEPRKKPTINRIFSFRLRYRRLTQ